MAISIDYTTGVIFILQADLTPISGTLYELDVETFRRELLDLQDDESGMAWPDTHRHNSEVTIAGVTYSQFVEIINGYRIEFEDGLYSVRLVGANNNLWDVQSGILVQNSVQVIPTNSAGLITVTQGSGVTAQDKLDIADALLDRAAAVDGFTPREIWKLISAILFGKADGFGTSTVHFRDAQDTKNRITATVNEDGNRLDVSKDAS